MGKYLLANWKSNKNSQEIKEWFQFLSQFFSSRKEILSKVKIIIFPPFPYLSLVKDLVAQSQLAIKIGAQDISPFSEGAYTGEVSGKMLAEFAEYVLIGHSERRLYFREEEKMLQQKVQRALENRLKVVFCLSSKEDFLPSGVSLVAYEPVWAIGSGKAETPERAEEIASFFKREKGIPLVIYGGSVNPENVCFFWQKKNLDGLLLGGASLRPEIFCQIIFNVSQN